MTAVEAPPVADTATARRHPRRVAFIISRIEGRRMMSRAFFWFAAAVSVALLIVPTWSKAPVMHRDDTFVALSMLPVAVATYLLSNLAVTRARRNGTEELYDSAPSPAVARTTAHLLALAWPVGFAILLTAGEVAYLKISGGVWAPSPQEIATGPMIVLLGGTAGVLVGRVVPSAIAGTVGLISLGSVQLFLMQYSIDDGPPRARWGAFWLNGDEFQPRELFFRPAGWHLLYLTGAAALFMTAARLRHGVKLLRVAACVAAVAVLATGVWGQSRRQGVERRIPPEVALRGERLVCETRGDVSYCALQPYAPWVSRWHRVVSSVFAAVPVTVRPGLEVRQVLTTPFVDPTQHGLPDPAASSVVEMQTTWGNRFEAGIAELGLATRAAAWAVGLPVVYQPVAVRWTEESIRQYEAQLGPGSGPYERPAIGSIQTEGICTPSSQARSIIALWLAARSTPDAANALRAAVRQHPYGVQIERFASDATGMSFGQPVLYVDDWPYFISQHVEWGTAEAHYAAQLLERPSGEVARIVRENWHTLIQPTTTTDEALHLFGLKRLPTIEEQFRAAGVDPREFLRRLFPNVDPAKMDASVLLRVYEKSTAAPCP